MKFFLTSHRPFRKILSPLSTFLAIMLLLGSHSAHAYVINYSAISEYQGGNVNGSNLALSTNSDGFSLSDSYNQYSQATWNIVSAVDDGSGGVNVVYDDNPGAWDSYTPTLGFTFTILSDDGSLSPEAVSVDAWGGLSLDSQVQQDPFVTACCVSGVFVSEPLGVFPVSNNSTNYDALTNHYSYTQSGTFNDSYTLFTNTTYSFYYEADLYIEGNGNGGGWPPQSHFASWDDYNAFVATYGDSGLSYASVFGSFNYNMALSDPASVPEPASILLLLSALLGYGGAMMRKKKS